MSARDYIQNPIALTVSDRDFHRWLTKGWAALRGDDGDPSTSDAGPPRSSLVNTVMGLTLEDLRTPPKPWRRDFLDSGQGLWESYALPQSEMELEGRLEGNIEAYLGNYVAILCIAFVCVMFKRPYALVAMVVLVKLWDLFLKYCKRPDINVYSTQHQYITWAFQIGSALMVIYSQVMLPLVLAALLGGAGILAHGACRRHQDPFYVINPDLRPQRSQSVVVAARDVRRRNGTRRATTGSM